jgi:hypothetical protein
VLLDQARDLEERREEIPFVLSGIDWIRQGFVVVEGLEERIEVLE